MVVRIWRARATRENSARYVEYFNAHVLPELRSVPGYAGSEVLVGPGEEPEIVVATRWASYDAVRQFAGDALDAAVVHPAAAALLSDFDRHVVHYEVAAEDGPRP